MIGSKPKQILARMHFGVTRVLARFILRSALLGLMVSVLVAAQTTRSSVNFGSIPSGTANKEVLHLTLRDAITMALRYNLGVGFWRGRRVVVAAISDAEPAAKIDVVDRMPVGSQSPHKLGKERERIIERLKIGDLRTDMHIDAVDAQARQGASVGVDVSGPGDWHTELVL